MLRKRPISNIFPIRLKRIEKITQISISTLFELKNIFKYSDKSTSYFYTGFYVNIIVRTTWLKLNFIPY